LFRGRQKCGHFALRLPRFGDKQFGALGSRTDHAPNKVTVAGRSSALLAVGCRDFIFFTCPVRKGNVMDLLDFYAEAVNGRVTDLVKTIDHAPDLPIVLARLVDKLITVVAVLESGYISDGWDDDARVLRAIATDWSALADAFRVVQQRYERAGL
jgi:hypothetical protein